MEAVRVIIMGPSCREYSPYEFDVFLLEAADKR